MTNHHALVMKHWSEQLDQSKRYADEQLTVKHCHASYIRGWCDLLEGVERGFRTDANPFRDNPFSKYYFYSKYKSWEAGRDDAWNYLAGL